MDKVFQKFLRSGIDLSPVGVERREDNNPYFCTPKGASIFGWAGVDGIHFCFVRDFGGMVFSVSPMNSAPDFVHPLANDFEDFLRLLLACSDSAALEQAWMWDKAQFEAFLQDNPPTQDQQRTLSELAEKMKLTPMEQPWVYIKKLQASFDYSKIKYTEDYYDVDMNPEAEPTMPEWKVYFDGNFWGHSGKDHAGTEIRLNKQFDWARHHWVIPAAYSCSKGLVMDFCMRTPEEDIRKFITKWDLHPENDSCEYFTQEQQMQIDLDNPLVHNHLIFNAVDFVDYHAYKSYKRIYYDMREVSDRLCKENGLSVIPPSQNKGMGYKEYTEAKRGTSWKQKLKQTIDRLVITAKDYDDFLRLMQEAGYEIKTGKYISFRAEGQERFTRSKTIGENYTEERIKERIAGRTPRRNRRQTVPKGISLIGDIQERIRLIDSKGYEYKAKLTILKEAARTLNYLTENNLLQYADLEKKVEDVHSSYDRTGKELKGVEARLREVQPLIKNISNYQRLKPVYDAFQKAKDKPGFKAKHEAELVIFEAARSTLLAMQGDEKLPSLKTLQAQQQRLLDEQQRLYDERAKLKKEVKQIETIKSNVDTFLAPSADHDRDHLRSTQRE